jgi:class 3 adenylate cyclase
LTAHRGAPTLTAGTSIMADLADLPTGTVTFLFTDLEGSTRLLAAHPAAYRAAVARHHALLRGAVEAHGGAVFETVGDAVYAAFAAPTEAVAAAVDGQLALRAEDWGDVGELRARMGLHLGEVERQGGHYFGAPLYRCARLTAAAHGGQVVLSEAAAVLVRGALAAGGSPRAHPAGPLLPPGQVACVPGPPRDPPALAPTRPATTARRCTSSANACSSSRASSRPPDAAGRAPPATCPSGTRGRWTEPLVGDGTGAPAEDRRPPRA